MKVKVKTQEKDLLEFTIEGERHTFPNLLRSRLLNDSEVVFASYDLNHPVDNEAQFILRTKSKDPKKILLNACKDISDELDDFQKKLKKAVK